MSDLIEIPFRYPMCNFLGAVRDLNTLDTNTLMPYYLIEQFLDACLKIKWFQYLNNKNLKQFEHKVAYSCKVDFEDSGIEPHHCIQLKGEMVTYLKWPSINKKNRIKCEVYFQKVINKSVPYTPIPFTAVSIGEICYWFHIPPGAKFNMSAHAARTELELDKCPVPIPSLRTLPLLVNIPILGEYARYLLQNPSTCTPITLIPDFSL